MLPNRRWISCFASRYLRRAKDHPRTTTTLAFETVSAGELNGVAAVSSSGTKDQPSPLVGIILHGLLGSGRNWRSFARKVANSVTGSTSIPVQLHLLDLRNHGSSSRLQGIHPPHTMETAAQDIIHLVKHALGGQTPDLMIGHSLGGKVLLELLQQLQQEGLQQPKQAWVLDSQPGKVNADVDQPSGVARVIHTISSIPLPVPSRQWLYQHLQQQGFSAGISQWLGSNLTPDPDTGKLLWSFNIQGAAAMYNSYRANDYLPLLAQPPQGCELHLVRGELSDRWSPSMVQELQRCQEQASAQGGSSNGSSGVFKVHVLPKAGHWLHTDNPDALHALVHEHALRVAVAS